jgi:hypothetical protein
MGQALGPLSMHGPCGRPLVAAWFKEALGTRQVRWVGAHRGARSRSRRDYRAVHPRPGQWSRRVGLRELCAALEPLATFQCPGHRATTSRCRESPHPGTPTSRKGMGDSDRFITRTPP